MAKTLWQSSGSKDTKSTYTIIEDGKVKEEEEKKKKQFGLKDAVNAATKNSGTTKSGGAAAPSSASVQKAAEEAAAQINAKNGFDFKKASASGKTSGAEERAKDVSIKSALSDEGIQKAKAHQKKVAEEKQRQSQLRVANSRASIPVDTQTKNAQENAAAVNKWLDERRTKREQEEKEAQAFAQKTIQKYGIDAKNFTPEMLHGIVKEKAKEEGISEAQLLDANFNYSFARFSDTTARELNVLNVLAANNHRRALSQKDLGTWGTGTLSTADSLGLGVIDDLGDISSKREYKKAGLPMEDYESATYGNVLEKSVEEHPVAYGVGQVAGSVPWWFAGGGGAKTVSGVDKARSAFNAAQATTKAAKAAQAAVGAAKTAAPALKRLVGFSALRKATDALDSDSKSVRFQHKYKTSLQEAASKSNAAGALAYATNTIENIWDTPSQVVDTVRAYVRGIVTGDEVTLNTLSSNWYSLARKQAAYEGIMSDKTGAARMAWSIGLNLADNVIRSVMSGGAEAATSLMAGSAFTSTVKQTYEETGDIHQATANGIVQASLEYITERMPTSKFFEAIDNPATAKELVGNILKSMGLDGFGELVNALAGNAAELTILGDHSAFTKNMNAAVQVYTFNGMDEETAKEKALKETFVDFFILQPLTAGMEGALSAGIMQGLANTIGMVKQRLSGKSEQQKTVDDMLSPLEKKETTLNGVDTKVSATMAADTAITADTNGVVAVDATFTPGIAKVTDALSKRTGLKFGYAEYYQNGRRNDAYNGHYDPTTKTIYFRKGASKAEIIYQTAVHELTHFTESSKHYAYVSDYVLNKKFEGVNSDAYKNAVKEKISAYAKNGIELTPEEARRELVAENIREVIFATEEDVDKLVKTDYTFAQRILDIIDSFIYYFNNKFGRLEGDEKTRADLEQAQRKYRLALASAKGMRGSGQSISYDMKMDYRHQMDLALGKKLKSGLSVYIGKASNFLVKCGLDADLPMLMNQSHLRDINHPKSEENRHWHGLSPEIIKQIPNELKNPVMVYDSISPQNAANSICVVTSLKDADGLPIIVSIRVEGYGKNRYLNVEAVEQTSLGANFVTSAYGREEFFAHIENVLQNNALIYANKNKTHRLFSGSELELLTRLNNLGFDKIIHPSRNIVKPENKNRFSFSSPKSDTTPAGLEDFDVRKKVNPELQKMLDDHAIVQSDGDVQQANPELQKSIADHEAVFEKKKAETKDAYDALVDKYGAIEKGEKPVRDVNVPKRSAKNKYVSQFARTMMEAGVTPDDAVSEFERKIVDGNMAHIRLTDKDAIAYGNSRIAELGFDGALDYWNAISSGDGIPGKNDIVLGQILYNQCINAKDAKTAMKIAGDLCVVATRAGQATQAFRVLKQMTPDGQLYCLEKSVQTLTRDLEKALGKKFKGITINEELAKAFLESKTEDAKTANLEKLQADIASQIPSTWMDKWDAWRYLSMLGNPRTHFRNVVGNMVFLPTRKLKNVVGALIEKTLPKEKRTKSLHKSKEAKAFAKDDFVKVEGAISGDTGKYDVSISGIEGKRKIFKNKFLEALRKGNSYLLEKEDVLFMRGAYIDSFAQMMTARGITADYLNNGTAEAANTLEEIRAYAIDEAQKATFRDANALAQILTKGKRHIQNSKNKYLKAAYYATVEGVMPFKNTPLNIAKQGIMYSPVSFVKVLAHDISAVRNGKMEANTLIDDIAKGVTGTALLAVGAYLFNAGLITGGDDEDDKKRNFDETTGWQGYSLVIGDNTYTIDWAAPSVLPLFVGVELMDSLLNEEGLSFKTALGAISKITDPILELSCLQSIESLLETVSYNQDNAISAIFTDAMLSYAGQAVPTLLGQIARTIDGTTRSTYVDKNSQMPSAVSKFIQQTMKKLPMLTYLLQPKLDMWGREVSYGDNALERALENFVSPGYLENADTSEVTQMLNSLYEYTGDNAVFPTAPSKNFTEKGVEYNLTGEQYTFLAKRRGEQSLRMITELLNQSWFSTLSDEEKIENIKMCYEAANEDSLNELKEWYFGGEANESALDSNFVLKELYVKKVKQIEGEKDETGNTIEYSRRENQVKWIYRCKDLNDKQRAILYREGIITNYKPYQVARACGFDDEVLAKYYPYFMMVEPDYKADGKTVPLSYNKNIRRLANKLGLTQEQKDAVYYYFYSSSSKERKQAEAKILNKLYKKLTPEQKKDFVAWYEDNDKRVDEKKLLKVLEGLN